MDRTQSSFSQHKDRYLEALTKGDESIAQQVVESALLPNVPIYDVYNQILAPAHIALNAAWSNNSRNVSEEHLATQITAQVIERLRTKHASVEPNGFRVVVGTLGGPSNGIGARFIADFFFYDGWEVDSLPASASAESIIEKIEKRSPTIVVIEVTQKTQLHDASRIVKSIRGGKGDTKIVLAGVNLPQFTDPTEKLGADFIVTSAQQALDIGRKIIGMTSDTKDLPTYLKEIGQRVQHYRKLRNMSQQALANRADLDRTYISALENGKQNSTIQALMKLAGALSIPVEKLLVYRPN